MSSTKRKPFHFPPSNVPAKRMKHEKHPPTNKSGKQIANPETAAKIELPFKIEDEVPVSVPRNENSFNSLAKKPKLDKRLPEKSPQKKEPPTSVFESVMVRLAAGKKASIQVHSGLVSWYSGTFSILVEQETQKPRPKNAKNDSKPVNILIDMVDQAILDGFRTWLYCQRFGDPVPSDSDNDKSEGQDSLGQSELMLCKLWKFAEKYQIPRMQNDAVKAIHQRVNKTWDLPHDAVMFVYEKTDDNSKLRQLLVKQYLAVADAKFRNLGIPKEILPPAFAWDLATGFADFAHAGGIPKPTQNIWRHMYLDGFFVPEAKETLEPKQKTNNPPVPQHLPAIKCEYVAPPKAKATVKKEPRA